MSMHLCERCGGFIPQPTVACPNCRIQTPSVAAAMRMVAVGAVIFAGACIPTMAYGCPEGGCPDPERDGSAEDANTVDAHDAESLDADEAGRRDARGGHIDADVDADASDDAGDDL